MTVGIYAIVHNLTGRTYVGQSRNIEKRQRQHLHGLETGIHHNWRLQRDWDESSFNPYTFKVIYKLNYPDKYDDEELKDILDLLEWKFLETYGEETETYNLAGVRKPPPTNIPQDIIDNLFDGEVWVLPEYRESIRVKETHYNEYVRLLDKYKVRHPMEKWSSESYTRESREYRLRKYIQDSRPIMDRMKLVGDQRIRLMQMLRTIPLKKLNGNLGYEKIIICLCIYIRKSDGGGNFRWQEYAIVKEHDLTIKEVLSTITNLCAWYNTNRPIPLVNEKKVLECHHMVQVEKDTVAYARILELQREVEYWKRKCMELERMTGIKE